MHELGQLKPGSYATVSMRARWINLSEFAMNETVCGFICSLLIPDIWLGASISVEGRINGMFWSISLCEFIC